jgi:hypothetical protein
MFEALKIRVRLSPAKPYMLGEEKKDTVFHTRRNEAEYC